MVKVLLINPKSTFGLSETVIPPMGLLYVAGVLEKHNQEVRIIDTNALDISTETLIEEVKKYDPDIVGVTGTTPQAGEIRTVSETVSENFPDILLVMGGPHATIMPKECLKDFLVDVVVRGEGEHTMLELVETYEKLQINDRKERKKEIKKHLHPIKGIAFNNGESTIVTETRPLIQNLDELPFPARHLLDMSKYKTHGTTLKFMPILSSRGCPGQCMYCTKFIFGAAYRGRNPESVIQEMIFLKEHYKFEEFDFLDDNLTCDIQRMKRLCSLIIEHQINIPWRCTGGTRIDAVTEPLLALMKKSGCVSIAYGIESGDDNVLRLIGKNITTNQIRETVTITKRIGIDVTGFFMLGLPFDTKESMQKTIDFAKELDLAFAQFTITTPLPGTRLWIWINNSHNVTMLTKNPADSDFFSTVSFITDNFTEEDVIHYFKKAYRTIYFQPKYIIRTLLRIRNMRDMRRLAIGIKTLWGLLI